jgi:hypothetical protein
MHYVRHHLIDVERSQSLNEQGSIKSKSSKGVAPRTSSHGLLLVGSRDENGTDSFRPYSRPNSFRRVQICPYPSPNIQYPIPYPYPNTQIIYL